MFSYPTQYNQIQPGYIDHDAVSSNLGNRGETSVAVRNLENSPYGRTLAGLGNHPETPGDEDYEDDKLERMEDQDDVVGSGIFDDGGSESTIHADLGVFADHPNLPGYIARETQFEPNESLVDVTTGGDVIGIPGGGMTNGGPLIGPGTLTPQLPFRYHSQLVPPTGPSRTPVRQTYQTSRPYAPSVAPMVNTASQFRPQPAPVRRPPTPCGCYAPPPPPPARRTRQMATAGFGEATTDQASWLPWVAGGLIAGAAVALFAGTLSIKPRTR